MEIADPLVRPRPRPPTLDLSSRPSLPLLRSRVSGQVLAPGDHGYAAATSIWNLARQGRPRAVVRCHDAQDIATCLTLASTHGCPVTVRGTGYDPLGAAGHQDALVIDTRAMAGVRIDPARSTVTVGAGTTWAELDAATAAVGRVVPGPPIAAIGVIGSTLSGGHGHLRRRFGLTADNLVAARLVLADGSWVRAGGDENSDLLWGLRGGSGNFGVVTEMTFRLSPMPRTLVSGAVMVAAAQSRGLLRFYREYTAALDDDVTTSFALTGAQHSTLVTHMVGELPSVPVASVVVACTAEYDVAHDRVEPIRRAAPTLLDTITSHPYVDLQAGAATGYPPGMNSSLDTVAVGELDEALQDVLLARFAAMPRGGCEIKVDHMGGAVASLPMMSSAVPYRHARYLILVLARWAPDNDGAAQQAWQAATMRALAPLCPGGPQPGMVSREVASEVVYGRAHVVRLRALKTKVDPRNVFAVNQNITPYA